MNPLKMVVEVHDVLQGDLLLGLIAVKEPPHRRCDLLRRSRFHAAHHIGTFLIVAHAKVGEQLVRRSAFQQLMEFFDDLFRQRILRTGDAVVHRPKVIDRLDDIIHMRIPAHGIRLKDASRLLLAEAAPLDVV